MVQPTTLQFGRDGETVPDRLIWGDNLEVLPTIADGCIDSVYLDPPFATGAVRRGRPETPSTGTALLDDTSLDTTGGARQPQDNVPRYRDRADDPEAFVDWLWPRLEHTHRVLAPHGSLFLHLDYRAMHYAKVALDRLFGRSRFINEIVWCYAVGGKSRRGFGRKHDTILWYARGDNHAFYPDAIRVPRRAGSHMRVVRDESGRPVQEKTDRRTGRVYRYPVADGKVPEDWWTDIETLNHSDRERTGWPTQKPERLIERLLRATTREGDLVADWFSGSGTTAVVAQRERRRFLAVDAEPDAIRLATSRLLTQGQSLATAGAPPPPLTIEIVRNGAAPARATGSQPAAPMNTQG